MPGSLGTSAAKNQRTGLDGGQAIVVVGPGESERSRAGLSQSAGAGESTGEQNGVAVGIDVGVSSDSRQGYWQRRSTKPASARSVPPPKLNAAVPEPAARPCNAKTPPLRL